MLYRNRISGTLDVHIRTGKRLRFVPF